MSHVPPLILLLTFSISAAGHTQAALAPVPHLDMEPRSDAIWGEQKLRMRTGLSDSDEGPLEQMAASRCASPFAPNPLETEPEPPLWGSPLQMSWFNSVPVRCSAALDASYSVPESSSAALGEYLDGGRFRAWIRSGLQWRYTADAVLSVDARWSPAGLGGFDAVPPFQAAATVTVPW